MLPRKMFAGRWRKALWAMVLVPTIAIYNNLPGRKQIVMFPNAIGYGSLAVDRLDLWQQQVQTFLKQTSQEPVTE